MTFLEKFKAARRAGVPIMGVETADPAATISTIKAVGGKLPLLQWDIVRGLSPVNELGDVVIKELCNDVSPALVTGNPMEMLSKIEGVPESTVVFMHQANALLESSDAGMALPVSQGIWNLRDIYKGKKATLVLMGASILLPQSLKNDVMIIDEPLPAIQELTAIVKDTALRANANLTDDQCLQYGKSLLGLSAFAAEQSFATSLKKVRDEITVDDFGLWDRKCKAAEQTKGLSIYRGAEAHKDVVGYDNVKKFLQRIMAGPDPVEVFVFIDEIEKQLAGFGSDLSGVTGEQMGKMLTWMQSMEALGVLFVGAPGTGKSLIGVSTGNEAKKPTVIFDLSSMKGSLVGKSIANLNAAQKQVNAMAGGGRIMVIGTCNRFGSLPPELRRRFNLGTFFFDLPTGDERVSLWEFYQSRFQLRKEQISSIRDDGWTGAEIKNACNIAWRLNCSLSEASNYVVPVCKSGAEDIERLRNMAEGKFISASEPGFYARPKTVAASSQGRKISFEPEEH